MIWSQETCLFDNRRYTHERWEGDLLRFFRNSNEFFLCVGKTHFYFNLKN